MVNNKASGVAPHKIYFVILSVLFYNLLYVIWNLPHNLGYNTNENGGQIIIKPFMLIISMYTRLAFINLDICHLKQT